MLGGPPDRMHEEGRRWGAMDTLEGGRAAENQARDKGESMPPSLLCKPHAAARGSRCRRTESVTQSKIARARFGLVESDVDLVESCLSFSISNDHSLIWVLNGSTICGSTSLVRKSPGYIQYVTFT